MINEVNKGVSGALLAGTALVGALGGSFIYFSEAPDNKAPPYVVFSYTDIAPDNQTPADLWTASIYVRAYASNASQAGTLDSLIQSILHKGSITVTGYKNFWAVRRQAIVLLEAPKDNSKLFSMGAIYQFRLGV